MISDEDFYPNRLMWEDGVWAQRIPADFQFEEGKKYLRLDGKIVTVIKISGDCFQADDGADGLAANIETYKDNEFYNEREVKAEDLGWRYNRRGCLGRCTGSRWDNPRNLIPFEVKI